MPAPAQSFLAKLKTAIKHSNTDTSTPRLEISNPIPLHLPFSIPTSWPVPTNLPHDIQHQPHLSLPRQDHQTHTHAHPRPNTNGSTHQPEDNNPILPSIEYAHTGTLHLHKILPSNPAPKHRQSTIDRINSARRITEQHIDAEGHRAYQRGVIAEICELLGATSRLETVLPVAPDETPTFEAEKYEMMDASPVLGGAVSTASSSSSSSTSSLEGSGELAEAEMPRGLGLGLSFHRSKAGKDAGCRPPRPEDFANRRELDRAWIRYSKAFCDVARRDLGW